MASTKLSNIRRYPFGISQGQARMPDFKLTIVRPNNHSFLSSVDQSYFDHCWPRVWSWTFLNCTNSYWNSYLFQQLISLSFSFCQQFYICLSLKLTATGINLSTLWRWNKTIIMIIPWRRISVKELPMNTGKNQTNVTCGIMHFLTKAIWGDIRKRTVEKSQTNATSVIIHPLMQAIWGDIWKHTVEKSQTNATNVTMHPLWQEIWGDI